MITCDYKIVRDEKDEKRTITPKNIPKQLPDIVYIEGPNDSGKSTLLNILAVSFYGLKNKKISRELTSRMEELVNSKDQKTTFNVEVTDKSGKKVLMCVKKNPDRPEIEVYEFDEKGKGTKIIPEVFGQRYRLIYDIPEHPTDRLPRLIEDVRDAQVVYEGRIGGFKQFVSEVITQIKRRRDPDRLEQLKRDLKKLEDGKKESEPIVEELRKDLEVLKKYYCYRAYDEVSQEHKRKSMNLANLTSQLDRKVDGRRREVKKVQRLDSELIYKLGEMKNYFSKITDLLRVILKKKESYHLDIWEKIDLQKAYDEREFPETLDDEITALTGLFEVKKKEEKDSQNLLDQFVFYERLIDFLEAFISLNFNVPGPNMSIEEFIRKLREEKMRIDPEIKLIKNINEALTELEKLKELKYEITKDYFEKIMKSRNEGYQEFISEAPQLSIETTNLGIEVKELSDRLDILKAEFNSMGRPTLIDIERIGDYRKFSSYTTNQLKEKKKELQDFIDEKEKEIKSKIAGISFVSNEIKRIESAEPHKYEKRLADLERLFESLEDLQNLVFNKFGTFVYNIINEKINEDSELTKEQSDYNKSISNYLAKKIPFFPIEEKEYEVESIDMIKKTITMKGNKTVKMKWLGTGRSQSAFITGLLGSTDDRKIIALFDEVAAMDEKSLGPVIKRMQELYKENRLLIGMVVQKGKEVKIESMV